jgi:hypothetical protein
MVEITARSGEYLSGLAQAAKRLTPSEAAIIADLETHGLDVQQLREVLCGAHVLVDQPEHYESWRFPDSRERLSSHHPTIDKAQFPDVGLKGPLVREKLHGRTQAGTWVQLEKTPAAMGHGFKLPSMTDVRHLMDYIVYRITKRNVGPWGLSGMTEKRPMYLSPDPGATMPLPAAAEKELVGALERIEDDDDTTSASADLAARFAPPDRANTLAEIVFVPGPHEKAGPRAVLRHRRVDHRDPLVRGSRHARGAPRTAALDAAAGSPHHAGHDAAGQAGDRLRCSAGPARGGGRGMKGTERVGDAEIPKDLVDAVVHLYGLRTIEDAMKRLYERLPSGDRGPSEADADAVLAASPHTALVSVSHWDSDGTRHTHDIVLAHENGTCHVFARDPGEPSKLVAQALDDDEWRELVERLAVPRPGD